MSETRRYERIDIELPCRLFIPGEGGLRFEAFCVHTDGGGESAPARVNHPVYSVTEFS